MIQEIHMLSLPTLIAVHDAIPRWNSTKARYHAEIASRVREAGILRLGKWVFHPTDDDSFWREDFRRTEYRSMQQDKEAANERRQRVRLGQLNHQPKTEQAECSVARCDG